MDEAGRSLEAVRCLIRTSKPNFFFPFAYIRATLLFLFFFNLGIPGQESGPGCWGWSLRPSFYSSATYESYESQPNMLSAKIGNCLLAC